MPLETLRIETLRCLSAAELELAPGRNLLIGPNGAGKTSVLEAVYLLGRGRSFRTHETGHLIQRGAQGFSIFGTVRSGAERHRLGLGLGADGFTRRLDGAPAEGMAGMAALLPVYAIEPGSHQLIEGGPRGRRQFLDWAVFHVEHGYIDLWRQYRKALAQRNAGLKAGASPGALAPWTHLLAEAGERIDSARGAHTARLEAPLAALGQRLIGQELGIRYARGWRKDSSLHEALQEALPRERMLGSTQVGPHRADWQVLLEGIPVRQGASRGQQKLAAIALILAQLRLEPGEAGPVGTLLVDDPAAELDQERLGRVLEVLAETPGQQIVTGLEEAPLGRQDADRVFHVEQGTLRRML